MLICLLHAYGADTMQRGSSTTNYKDRIIFGDKQQQQQHFSHLLRSNSVFRFIFFFLSIDQTCEWIIFAAAQQNIYL